MQAILWPIVSWLLRGVVVKFVIFTGLFAILALLMPKAAELLATWTGTASLTSAFAGLPVGVWWFLDFFQLGYGVPLMISAFVTRFLIRRLPVIG